MPVISPAIIEAVVVGALLGSLADWLFAGILFHAHYQTYPEVWRDGAGERGRIVIAQALALLTSAVFVLLAATVALTGPIAAAKLAIAIWLIGPLPMLIANHMFIKIDPRITASHAVGWLAKLLLVAATTAFFLR